jgi:hypothetical protein
MPVKETLERISQDENFHGTLATTGHDTICNIDVFSIDTPFNPNPSLEYFIIPN